MFLLSSLSYGVLRIESSSRTGILLKLTKRLTSSTGGSDRLYIAATEEACPGEQNQKASDYESQMGRV
jgi:hypothetical protein